MLPVCLLVAFVSVSHAASWNAQWEQIHQMYYNLGQQKEAIQALEDQLAAEGTKYSDTVREGILDMLSEYFSISGDKAKFENIVYDMFEPNRVNAIVNHFKGTALYDSARAAKNRWLRPAAASIAVDKEELDIGESTGFRVSVTNQKKVPLSNPDVSVEVAPVDYARVEGGAVTALQPGTFNIVVKDADGNMLADRTITVREGLAVTLTPEYKELPKGESETFVVQSNKPFSQFEINLQIDPKGLVEGKEIPAEPDATSKRILIEAKKPGTATLKATGPDGAGLAQATIYVPPEPPSMLWPLVGSGATVVFAVYAIIARGSANEKFDEHEECASNLPPGGDPAECNDLHSDYESLLTRSNISWVLTAVAAAGTGYLWYKYFQKKGEYEKTVSESTRPVGFYVDPGQRQLVFTYNF
jgi:hypothetical protein